MGFILLKVDCLHMQCLHHRSLLTSPRRPQIPHPHRPMLPIQIIFHRKFKNHARETMKYFILANQPRT